MLCGVTVQNSVPVHGVGSYLAQMFRDTRRIFVQDIASIPNMFHFLDAPVFCKRQLKVYLRTKGPSNLLYFFSKNISKLSLIISTINPLKSDEKESTRKVLLKLHWILNGSVSFEILTLYIDKH